MAPHLSHVRPRTPVVRFGYQRPAISLPVSLPVSLIVLGFWWIIAAPASAQVRTKLPDRGTYTSPQIDSPSLRSVLIEDARRPSEQRVAGEQRGAGESDAATLRPAAYAEPGLVRPRREVIPSSHVIPSGHVIQSGHVIPSGHRASGDGVIFDEPIFNDNSFLGAGWNDSACDGCGSCGACDSGCDGACDGGCDSIGCDPLGRSAIRFSRDQWFGGVDLMLMFRNGDRLPPLVTTGPATNIETAGALDQATTQILAGDQRVFDDGTVGGRLTLGTWLDPSHCRSLVFRGWIAAEDTFGFNADQDDGVLTRPFLNVSAIPSEQDTLVVAFPGEATGSIHVRGSSNVFGGDLSVRQLWYSGLGGTVDVLYGYQYMRLDEDLRIASTSLASGDQLAPSGSVITVTDSFEAINEFHGGQFGLASTYREGCWSFRGLAKVGLGSLRRSAVRRGSTDTQLAADQAFNPNGLLVRSTNVGVDNDSTFGWVPELDFSLGWHHFPNFDVTVGYHIIAMTDALQVSGLIDPNLASNLSEPLAGTPSPSPALSFDTFYIQGIHVGLQYVY